MRFLLSSVLLLLGINISAQTLIRVIDKGTSEPIPYASLFIQGAEKKSKEALITNEKGEIQLPARGIIIVQITSNGYTSILDTIIPGKEHIVYLTASNLQLDDIVVTASAKPISRDKSIYKIDMISSTLIKERASTNLEELLSSQLNVRVEQNGSLGSSLRMQGLSGEQVKILVDGVPIIGRVNGNIDLTQINLQNADHVEIIEGPMSVIYGSDAIGGVINIISKENTEKNFVLSSNLYYESIGKYNASLSASYHKNHQSISITGSRNFFQGVALAGDTTRTETWRPWLQYNIDGSYIYAIAHHKIKLSSSYFTETYFIPGTPKATRDTLLSKDTTLFLKFVAGDAYNITSRFTNTLDYTYSQDKNTFNVVSSYSTFTRLLKTYTNDLSYLTRTQDAAGQDTQKLTSAMIRGIWANTSVQHLQIMAGTELTYDYAVDKADFGTKDILDAAGFFNLQYLPFKDFSIQPGLRVLYSSRFSAPLIYSLNLKYNLSEDLAIRASYAKGFRAPSLKELYFNFTQLDHNIHGNPNLKPEVSNNLNFAVNFKKSDSRNFYNIGLTSFFNQIKDKIDYLVYPNDQLKADYINLPIALYKNFGSNLDFTYQFRNILNIGISGGFTAVSKLSDTTSFFYSPNFAGNFSYKEKHSKIRFSLNYKYYGKFIEYTAEKEAGTEKYDITAQSIAGDYHNLDVQLARGFFNNLIEIAVGAKNIFNNTTVNLNNGAQGNNGLVGYGRTLYIKLNFNFEKR